MNNQDHLKFVHASGFICLPPAACRLCMPPLHAPLSAPAVCPRCLSPLHVPTPCPRCLIPLPRYMLLAGLCPLICSPDTLTPSWRRNRALFFFFWEEQDDSDEEEVDDADSPNTQRMQRAFEMAKRHRLSHQEQP